LKEKPHLNKKKKTKSRVLNKAHKKHLSHNLGRETPSKLKEKQIATPKTLVYKQMSKNSSLEHTNLQSINKVSSELTYDFGAGTNDSRTLRDSETENSNNYFTKFVEDQKKFEEKIQEDKKLLDKKNMEKKIFYKEEETKSEDKELDEHSGLVDRIKKELFSERGKEFKEILQKFINECQITEKVNYFLKIKL